MDNAERRARVIELGDQTKLFLEDATADYALFKAECQTLNPKIASVYQQAGLTPPAASPITILQLAQTGQVPLHSEVAEVLEVIADIGLFYSITTSLGPPAAKWLTNTKKIPATIAEKQLVDTSVVLYEDALGAARGVAGRPVTVDIAVTGADVAGHVVAGVVAGLAIGTLDLGLALLNAAEEKSHLQAAITALHPLRTATMLAKLHTESALASLKDTDALMDALDGTNPSPQILAAGTNVIVKTVEAELGKAATPASVAAELQKRDHDAKSHTEEDPAYVV